MAEVKQLIPFIPRSGHFMNKTPLENQFDKN